MQLIRNAIPNLLTLGNLACGMVAIVLLLDYDKAPPPFHTIGGLMIGAMVFDFADGFVARALKATSPIGKELDSLSDLVSFGVLPGLMVYFVLKSLMRFEFIQSQLAADGLNTTLMPVWMIMLPFVGLLIPLFSAYRLAKFNVDTRQSYGFLGLPTPANALFFLSIFLMATEMPHWGPHLPSRYLEFPDFQLSNLKAYFHYAFHWLYNPWVLVGLTLLFSILLITEIPLLAMKFKDYTWKGNWPRYVLILISVTLLAILWFRAIPLIIVLYFILSFIDTRIHKKV